LLKRFFRGASPKKRASGPTGSRAYAIGDVHGRLDLLRGLLAEIERDNVRRGPAKTYLVMLGDLIDRGPESCGVIDLLAGNPAPFARPMHLKGNHEEYFLEILKGDDDAITHWLGYGGYECCESYGVTRGWMLNATPNEIGDRLRASVPAAHVRFLEDMHDSFQFGDYLFVHAGIRPGVPLAEQSSKDLRWIREGFLDDRTDHGLIVVHGHTIVDQPEQHPNRIALDTGAYRSGILTAIGLEGEERWFLTASAQLATAAA
jgi:serine/threonine protein phosphatase 1